MPYLLCKFLCFAYMINSPYLKRLLIGIFIGSLAGYVYYSLYGCERGCTISGNPFFSTAYGAILGGLLIASFQKETEKEEQ